MTGYAEFIQDMRPEPGEGATLDQVLGRAQLRSWYDTEGPEPERDPDEKAAALLARGYSAGRISDLSRRLADVSAELAGEREKLERGERLAARAAREHAAGRVSVWEMQAMLDGDQGDAARAGQLERRAASLRGQLEAAAATVGPAQERVPDIYEEAGRRAHREFAAVTRAKWEAIQAGRPARREPRPFGSASRGAADEQVTCPDCVEVGATPEQSYLIHADPDAPAGVRLAALTEADYAEYARETGLPDRPGGQEAGRHQPVAYR